MVLQLSLLTIASVAYLLFTAHTIVRMIREENGKEGIIILSVSILLLIIIIIS